MIAFAHLLRITDEFPHPTGSELFEVEVVAPDAEILDNVSDDAARHVTRMPGKSDEAVGSEGVRLMPVVAGRAEEFAADFAEPVLQLTAVPGRVFAHRSGSDDELVAKGWGNGPARFQQGLQMGLGGLLKPEDGLPPVLPVGVTARHQVGLGNPHVILVAADLNFGNGNNQLSRRVTQCSPGVKCDAVPSGNSNSCGFTRLYDGSSG